MSRSTENRPIGRTAFVVTALAACAAGCSSNPGEDPGRGVASRALSLASAGRTGPVSARDSERRAKRRVKECRRDPRVQLGLVSLDICVGASIFFQETFAGNGRTCGSCHPAAHNFTIDRDYIAELAAGDPLFVDESDPKLAELERPDLLRGFGLVTVNADGFDDPTQKFVMRSVSHIFSLATSLTPPPSNDGKLALDHTNLPPNERTGWGGDGAPGSGELRDFTDGAVTQHLTQSLARVPGVDFVLPSDAERNAISAYMMSVGRKNELDLAAVQLSDAAAERGRSSFVSGAGSECNDCHHNAGANIVVTDDSTGVSFLGNFTLEVGTEIGRLPILDQLGIPYDGGFGTRPHDTDRDGVMDSFGNGAFNIPPLIEAADTAPLFHTNAAETIEDAIRFYTTDAFANALAGSPSPERPHGGPMLLSDDDVADLGRFLRVLNAAFNCQLAMQRLSATVAIHDAYGAGFDDIEAGLLALARVEVVDALTDLAAIPNLSAGVQARLRNALRAIDHGLHERGGCDATKAALEQVSNANTALGDGMVFQLGEGTLMF